MTLLLLLLSFYCISLLFVLSSKCGFPAFLSDGLEGDYGLWCPEQEMMLSLSPLQPNASCPPPWCRYLYVSVSDSMLSGSVFNPSSFFVASLVAYYLSTTE